MVAAVIITTATAATSSMDTAKVEDEKVQTASTQAARACCYDVPKYSF